MIVKKSKIIKYDNTEVKSKKKSLVIPLCLFILLMGVGFAYLSTNLSMFGGLLVSGNKFDVHYENIKVKDGSVASSIPTITDSTSLDFDVVLDKPGDFYEFKVDVVNDGTIDAMIENIDISGLSDTTLLDSSITWRDGAEIDKSQLLKASSKDTIKVRVEYKKDINGSDLNDTESTKVSVSVTTPYIESDDTAYQREKIISSTFLKSGNTALYDYCEEYFSSITKMYFLDEYKETPSNAIKSWDASYQENGEINAYIVDDNNDGDLEVYISQEGGVVLSDSADSMFLGFLYLDTLDVSTVITDNVHFMSAMFGGLCSLKAVNVSNFNTSNVESMDMMFNNCGSLTNLDVSNFDTSNVTTMFYMFFNCDRLITLDLSNFNTSNVTDMSGMFEGCLSLIDLNISSFDTGRVVSVTTMFRDCYNLRTLDLSSFDTSTMFLMSNMFQDAKLLEKIYVSETWVVDESAYTEDMFSNCNKLVGAVPYDSNIVDGSMANYETGYLTYKAHA